MAEKNLVVTGCSSGFGLAIARVARDGGWRVFATVRSGADAAELEGIGCRVGLCDLTDVDSLARCAREVEEWSAGSVHALVNNAGSCWPAPVEQLSRDEMRAQFETNVFGHVDWTQRMLPAIKATGGRIVMISSVSVSLTSPLMGAYSASKRALEAFSESLAMELGPHGVDVVVVRPGPYRTAIWQTSVPRGDAHEAEDATYRDVGSRIKTLALDQDMSEPSELAHVVLDILGERRPRFVHTAPWGAALLTRFIALLPKRLYFWVVTRRVAGARPRDPNAAVPAEASRSGR